MPIDSKRLLIYIIILALTVACVSVEGSHSNQHQRGSVCHSMPSLQPPISTDSSSNSSSNNTNNNMKKTFKIVVAATQSNLGIGRKGDLPWKLPGDMRFFRNLTIGSHSSGSGRNCVIMGRKTYESIPNKFRPLSDRLNVVLSRNPDIRNVLSLPSGVLVSSSLEDALSSLPSEVSEVFVIGGGAVYADAMNSGLCDKIYLTEVEGDFEGIDTHFPPIPAHRYILSARSETLTEGGISYRFCEFDPIANSSVVSKATPSGAAIGNEKENVRIPSPSKSLATSSNDAMYSPNSEEQQYLDLCRDIIERGNARGDRTGTGTLSRFGVQMRFSLRDGTFPLLTTKKVFWRGVAEELLWFVKGSTNANELAAKDIHIWDGNGSKEFLAGRGLGHRQEGDLGPVYGFQWRHFGAAYGAMGDDYSGQGVDQLRACIDTIKNNPEDRRIIMTAWNPADLPKMALPPCHMFCQFYVSNGELSCQMYQRSADMGLGVPFNIASYSLLTVMVAQVCGLKCGDFVHSIGDAHVYSNHVDALRQQIARTPRAFPKIRVNPEVTDIDSFQYSDFSIEGYCPDGAIKMKMAV